MALNAAIVWEVRTSGSDNNGGGFKNGASGTDRTLQDAAHATLTTASTVHTTTTQINVAAGDYTVAAADVGNVLQITGGTATAGFYEITAVDTGNNRWTVDRSAGTAGQTVAGAMGGALATPGKAGGAASVSGHTVYIKNGTYTITTASTNVAGGCISAAVLSAYIGYSTTRSFGNTDTKPILILNAGVSSANITTGNAGMFYNLELDGNSQTTSRYSNVAQNHFIRCNLKNCTAANNGRCVASLATGNSAASFGGTSVFCTATNNTATPFTGAISYHCLAYANTGASTDGWQIADCIAIGCVSRGNGRDGFAHTSGQGLFLNCISESNSRYGFNGINATQMIACSTYNNTSGATNGSVRATGSLTPSGSVFVDAVNGNFALNNTDGSALRATGYPALLPADLTNSYHDVGAAQHQDAGGTTYIINIMD